MYRYSNGQISLSDFKQPVGMNLKENNCSGCERASGKRGQVQRQR